MTISRDIGHLPPGPAISPATRLHPAIIKKVLAGSKYNFTLPTLDGGANKFGPAVGPPGMTVNREVFAMPTIEGEWVLLDPSKVAGAGSIGTTELADGAVTRAKLAAGVDDELSIYVTGSGNGSITLNAGVTDLLTGNITGRGRPLLVHYQATLTIVSGGSVATHLTVDGTAIPGRLFYAGAVATLTYNGIVRVPSSIMTAAVHSLVVKASMVGNGHTLYSDWNLNPTLGDTNRHAMYAHEV